MEGRGRGDNRNHFLGHDQQGLFEFNETSAIGEGGGTTAAGENVNDPRFCCGRGQVRRQGWGRGRGKICRARGRGLDCYWRR